MARLKRRTKIIVLRYSILDFIFFSLELCKLWLAWCQFSFHHFSSCITSSIQYTWILFRKFCHRFSTSWRNALVICKYFKVSPFDSIARCVIQCTTLHYTLHLHYSDRSWTRNYGSYTWKKSVRIARLNFSEKKIASTIDW